MELGGRLGLLNINSTTTGGFSFGISNSFLGTNGGGNNNESSSSVRLAGAIILKIYWNFYSKEEYKR